ncbi:MAG TPA: hypothetical protein VMM84_02280 [Pyrinomonadaceae bacterium]|nr:hypothetical protein [Pyrinomonadaceae bacterium]
MVYLRKTWLVLIAVVALSGISSSDAARASNLNSLGPTTSTLLRTQARSLTFQSKFFQMALTRELRFGFYDRTERAQQLNQLTALFRSAADKLNDKYAVGLAPATNSAEVRELLRLGEELDYRLARSRLSYELRSDWREIGRTLSFLADLYETDEEAPSFYTASDCDVK